MSESAIEPLALGPGEGLALHVHPLEVLGPPLAQSDPI
jgi:hypothetical protein